jgi:hypothetical protein
MATERDFLIDLLENLLSLTERFVPNMSREERRGWQDISAKVADIETNTPCTKCGATDIPLHTNGVCGLCLE